VKKCNGLANNQKMRKGLQVLLQQPTAEMNGGTMQTVAVMNPTVPEDKLPAPPVDRPKLAAISDEDMRKQVKYLANGSAADVHGYTGELIKLLASDDLCLAAIKAITLAILNNELMDDECHARVNVAEQIAVRKPGQPADKLRPICLPSHFLKLADRMGLSLVSPSQFQKVFGDMQLGVGSAGGSEKAVHLLQLMHDMGKQQRDEYIMVNIDYRNAFNSATRFHIGKALYDRPELKQLRNLFRFAYGKPSLLLMYNKDGRLQGVLESLLGVKQGSGLASVLFALTVQDMLNNIKGNFPNVVPIAILDDVTLFGKRSEVLAAFDQLMKESKERNLHVNSSKCNVLHCSDQPSDELQEACLARGLPAPARSMKTLGMVVGNDEDAVRLHVDSRVEEMNELFAMLKHPGMRKQNTLALLRLCVLSKLNYLSRSVRPDLAESAMMAFDAKMKEAIQHLFGFTEADLQLHDGTVHMQMSLPIRMGGLGLKPYTKYTSALAFFAAHASAAAAANKLITKYVGGVQQLESPIAAAIEGCYDTIVRECTFKDGTRHRKLAPSIPATRSYSSFIQFYANGDAEQLQNHLAGMMDARRLSALKDTLRGNKTELARLNAIKSSCALTSMFVVASQRDYELDNFEFEVMGRLRHGVPPVQRDSMPATCSCRRDRGEVALSYDHLLTCDALTEHKGHIAAHNLVRDAVAKCATECGYVVDKEVRLHKFGIQPDLVMVSNRGQYIVVDVAGVMPTAKKYQARAAKQELGAADIRAAEKRLKYKQMCDGLGWTFVPFVFERFGGVQSEGAKLLRDMAMHARESVPRHRCAPLLFHMRAALAKTIHRGNALLVRMALQTNALNTYGGLRNY
jgi:hypothetical protein